MGSGDQGSPVEAIVCESIPGQDSAAIEDNDLDTMRYQMFIATLVDNRYVTMIHKKWKRIRYSQYCH